jgi:tRNA threonylcarbamoyladenosine biosynthesis protein TsaE
MEGRLPLYHLDLYRLEPEEVEALNLESYWEGAESPLGIVAIEWAERMPYQPPNYLHVRLTHQDEGRNRQVKLFSIGEFHLDSLERLLKN